MAHLRAPPFLRTLSAVKCAQIPKTLLSNAIQLGKCACYSGPGIEASNISPVLIAKLHQTYFAQPASLSLFNISPVTHHTRLSVKSTLYLRPWHDSGALARWPGSHRRIIGKLARLTGGEGVNYTATSIKLTITRCTYRAFARTGIYLENNIREEGAAPSENCWSVDNRRRTPWPVVPADLIKPPNRTTSPV